MNSSTKFTLLSSAALTFAVLPLAYQEGFQPLNQAFSGKFGLVAVCFLLLALYGVAELRRTRKDFRPRNVAAAATEASAGQAKHQLVSLRGRSHKTGRKPAALDSRVRASRTAGSTFASVSSL